MNDWLEKLHDIEGLDTINSWPPHPLFWLLLIAAGSLTAYLLYFLKTKRAFKKSWKYDALQKLTALEKNLSEDSTKQALILLSEYIRRIALQRFKREECAGLADQAWLKWLKKEDPSAFDWEKKGAALIEAPYAQECRPFSVNEVRELIKATKEWVR